MALEIARRLIAGVWTTGAAEEGNGGSSSVIAIVAQDSPITDSTVGPAAPAFQPVPFSTVVLDPDSLWNTETFAFDIATTGWYLCGLFVDANYGVSADNCVPSGVIQVNGAGNNIVQPNFAPTTDPQAFSLPAWSGITHLDVGDSVEVDLFTGSVTGTEETPSTLSASGLNFFIEMLRAGT